MGRVTSLIRLLPLAAAGMGATSAVFGARLFVQERAVDARLGSLVGRTTLGSAEHPDEEPLEPGLLRLDPDPCALGLARIGGLPPCELPGGALTLWWMAEPGVQGAAYLVERGGRLRHPSWPEAEPQLLQVLRPIEVSPTPESERLVVIVAPSGADLAALIDQIGDTRRVSGEIMASAWVAVFDLRGER